MGLLDNRFETFFGAKGLMRDVSCLCLVKSVNFTYQAWQVLFNNSIFDFSIHVNLIDWISSSSFFHHMLLLQLLGSIFPRCFLILP